MDEHDDDRESEVQDEAAGETDTFPETLDDVEDAEPGDEPLDIDPDESEL